MMCYYLNVQFRGQRVNFTENIYYCRKKKNDPPNGEASGVCALLNLGTRSLGM